MKKLKFIFIVALVLLVTGCSNSNITKVSYKKYEKLIEDKETFILEVTQKDCSACKSFKPKLEEVLKEYDLKAKEISIDDLTEEEIETFGISGTPTVIFYIDGEEETTAARLVGSASKDKIISKFKASDFIK